MLFRWRGVQAYSFLLTIFTVLEVCMGMVRMGMGIAFGLLMGMGIMSWEWDCHIRKRSPVLHSIATCSDR